MPNLSSAGTCSLPGCSRVKYVDPANGRVHDYCGRSHAFQAQQQGQQILMCLFMMQGIPQVPSLPCSMYTHHKLAQTTLLTKC